MFLFEFQFTVKYRRHNEIHYCTVKVQSDTYKDAFCGFCANPHVQDIEMDEMISTTVVHSPINE